MKKLLFSALILCALHSTAQTVNDIPVRDIDVEYVQIVGTSKMFTKKVTIELDFGQETKFFSSAKAMRINDENGKQMEFNSMIDELNFMSKNGFEFVSAYTLSVQNQNVYHYLMRKRR